MSKIKKILAVLVTLAMVMAMSVTAFAADTIIGNSDDVGTITVSGIDEESGTALKVYAYQIVKAKYENNGSFSGYQDIYSKLNLNPDANGDISITQSQLNDIIPLLPNDYTAEGVYEMTRGADKNYTATVPVGSYLVMVTGAETKVYSPMVVSVYYINSQGGNALDEGAVLTIATTNSWVKETSVPTIEKTIADPVKSENDVEERENSKGNSVDIGDTVNYTVTINSIPYYGGTHPTLVVNDTLDTGLTFNNSDDFAVKVVDSTNNSETPLDENTDYTLTVDGQNLTVNFVITNNDDNTKRYTLNAYQGKKVVITYSATLNSSAVFADSSNDNGVTLTYAEDSKVAGDTKTTDEKVTHTYTFDITSNLKKNGVGDDATGLNGAEFTLYTDSACTNVYHNTISPKDDPSTAEVEKSDVYVTKTVDGTKGRLEIKGLEAGVYYLKETKAPTGYSLNTHVYKIEVRAEGYNTDGTLTSWNMYVDNGTTPVSELDIPNTKISTLPSTGGIGTTIFTVGGCLIMIAAAALFFVSRRKASNK